MDSGFSNNNIFRNLSDGNGEDGILVSGSDNALGRNVARDNARDGLLADRPTDSGGGPNIDDGGNVGERNGRVQCQIDGAPCR